jgi:NADP-dependent 3-hydroxy acid dehydrogenase YdfG
MGVRDIAVVTGASSGIGAATARRLAAEGFHVVLAARRTDRLFKIAAELNGTAVTCDVTSDDSVAALASAVSRLDGRVTLLVNNAGGAHGADFVESGSVADWQWMYDVNVLGTLRVTQALLPRLIDSGDGVLLMLTSVAGLVSYEGGGGYNAAKHAQTSMTEVLRLELVGKPVRIVEVAPGMVHTEEFSLNRFRGDSAAADRVYQGVPDPLSADDVADAISWCVTRPAHVNIDRLVIRPRAQAAQYKIHRV